MLEHSPHLFFIPTRWIFTQSHLFLVDAMLTNVRSFGFGINIERIFIC